jgi:GAF domain-containing protein
MSLEADHAVGMSDSYRDALRYHRLLLALARVTGEVREIGEESYPSIEQVLSRLLPILTAALNAQQAFVATLRFDGSEGRAWLEVTAVYPGQELLGRRLTWSGMLGQLVKFGKPRVIDPLGEPTPPLVEGLELFEATSAILARMQVLDQVYLVGVCNQTDPTLGPFLAVDGKALDSIVELLAMGAQVGERRRRELESIQHTSAAISAELDLDELLPMIVKGAAGVFDAPAASLRLWDENEENLVIKAKWGLSDNFAQRQRIPKEKVEALTQLSGEFQSLLTTDLQSQPFGNVDLISQEHLQAVLGVPLRVRERLIGVLNIYSQDQSRRSTSYEQGLAQIFANQAAMALQNAERYERLKKTQEQLKALHKAGRIILARAGSEIARAGLEMETVMRAILDQAMTVTGAFFGTLQLVEGDDLKFVAVLPTERMEELTQKMGRLPIAGRGITARAVQQNHAQLIPDVTKDPDFVDVTGATGSELAVVLRRVGRLEDQPVGVLNVEHREVGGLTEEDRYLLIGLADLAVVSLDYAQQAEQLSRTNAIALMGAWGADIVHDIHREVGAIRRVVFSLLQRQELEPELRERLQKIDSYAGSLALPELPERAPEPGYVPTIRDAPLLDEVIRSEGEKLRQAYPKITLLLQPNCAEVRVAMHEQWLRRMVRHLVKNAVNAVSGQKEKRQIIVQTRASDFMADVLVEDTGKGVRPEIETLLFRRPIPHTGRQATEREGRGLLLVRYVVEMHGGQVWLDWSQPGQGARFAFNVPLAPP